MEVLEERWVPILGYEGKYEVSDHGNNHWKNLRILSAREHGLLHPCIANKAKNIAMAAAGHAKIAAMRQTGEIVGRKNVKKEALKTCSVE